VLGHGLPVIAFLAVVVVLALWASRKQSAGL
jgi:hypothetical protein